MLISISQNPSDDKSITLQVLAWFLQATIHIWVYITGENLDAVTAVTDSFKMADAFAGDRTGGAVAQTNAQRVDISVWQDRVWVNGLQKIYGPGWRVDLRANSAIVDPRDAAVTAPLFTVVVQ